MPPARWAAGMGAGEKTFILEAGCVPGRWLCCRRGQLFILEAGCVAGDGRVGRWLCCRRELGPLAVLPAIDV